MKKNLISIVILALLIVNIALSAITLISVAGTNQKTALLIADIASAIKLDIEGLPDTTIVSPDSVPMADIVTYDITDLTIPLSDSGDGKMHVAVMAVTLSMNSKSDDFATYSDLSTRESLIKGEINDVVAQYTIEEARSNTHAIEDEILQRIQTMFNSNFIFKVTFSSAMFQ